MRPIMIVMILAKLRISVMLITVILLCATQGAVAKSGGFNPTDNGGTTLKQG